MYRPTIGVLEPPLVEALAWSALSSGEACPKCLSEHRQYQWWAILLAGVESLAALSLNPAPLFMLGAAAMAD